MAEHLSSDIVAGYLEGAISNEETARVEAHLATCDECRREVIEVSRDLKELKRFSPWYVAGPVTAAAAIAAILFLGPKISGPDSRPVLRGTDTEAQLATTPRFQVVAPVDGTALLGDEVVFVWRSAAPDASYRLTLTEADGQVVWSTTTSDTTVAVPTPETLLPDRIYFWYVDALLADGQSTTTGVKQFSTLRQNDGAGH